MTTPTSTKRGPGPDRESGPVGLLARLFLIQLLAVLAVAAVIATVFSLAGLDRTTPAGEAAAPDQEQVATTPSPPPTTPPATSSAPSPTATATATATATEQPRPTVDVLNQGAGQGVARTTADLLENQGWPIGRVEDFNGTVRTTTVYYPAGHRADARALAGALPSAPRLLERFSTLSPRRLTVILVD